MSYIYSINAQDHIKLKKKLHIYRSETKKQNKGVIVTSYPACKQTNKQRKS